MRKIRVKFVISIVVLLIVTVFYIFFDEHILILKNYIFPIIFVYFIIDSLIILLPNTVSYLPTMKFSKKFYVKSPNYNKEKLLNTKKSNNLRALFTFILYFGALTLVGLVYLSYDFLEDIHLYLLFLLINVADYFCILFWCPFKSLILKNTCCYTCRITNWDRFMKSYILIFIPNIFTITLVVISFMIFLIWEYTHQIYPERFYSISNDVLRCNSCNETLCDKKKE